MMVFADGARYEGEWEQDKRDGYGTMYFQSGDGFTDGAYYTGYWSNNKRSGQGTLTWSTGHKYEGTWENDRM